MNCYEIEGVGTQNNKTGANRTNLFTAAELASGALCVKLNTLAFRQNIGDDAHPVFDQTHGIVKEVTQAGYATMYIGQAVDAPEGVSANTGKIEGEASNQILRLYPIEGTVPAWEPVVLSGAPGFYSFTPVDTDPVVQTDVLTWRGLGLDGTTNSYNEFADATFNSSAVYAGLASSGTGQYIQLRTKNSNEGIITTASGGNLKSVTIAFNAKTTDRVLNIYGKNEPYEAASDLFDSEKQGDLIASIAANDETFTAIPKAEYKYVGMASSNAALYIDQITVEWEEGGLVIPNIADNELKGTADDMTADGSQYVLAMPEGAQVGFYKAIVGSTISAGKAYLEPENASGIKAFLFGGDDATSIANVEKTIETGAIYNLAGQRLQKMQKGINIINGKKVLVK